MDWSKLSKQEKSVEQVKAQERTDRTACWQHRLRQTNNIQDWQALCKYNNQVNEEQTVANLLETTTLPTLKGPLEANRSECTGRERGSKCDRQATAMPSDKFRQMLVLVPLTVRTEKSATLAEMEIQ